MQQIHLQEVGAEWPLLLSACMMFEQLFKILGNK